MFRCLGRSARRFGYWAQASVAQLLQDNDGIFLVGNSAGLAKAAWKHDSRTGDPPLLLLGVPLLKVSDHLPLETVSKTEKAPGQKSLFISSLAEDRRPVRKTS